MRPFRTDPMGLDRGLPTFNDASDLSERVDDLLATAAVAALAVPTLTIVTWAETTDSKSVRIGTFLPS